MNERHADLGSAMVAIERKLDRLNVEQVRLAFDFACDRIIRDRTTPLERALDDAVEEARGYITD
jgi:hypothetical protein